MSAECQSVAEQLTMSVHRAGSLTAEKNVSECMACEREYTATFMAAIEPTALLNEPVKQAS